MATRRSFWDHSSRRALVDPSFAFGDEMGRSLRETALDPTRDGHIIYGA